MADSAIGTADDEWREMDARAVLDAVGTGVVVADTDGSIVYANAAAGELLARAAAALLGVPVASLVPPRLRDRHEAGFRRFVASREGAAGEHPRVFPALGPHGEELQVEICVSRAASPTGELVVATLRDARTALDLSRRANVARYLEASNAVALGLAAAGSAASLQHAASTVLPAVGEALGLDVGFMWEADDLAGVLRLVDAWSAPGDFAAITELSRELRLRPGADLAGLVWESGEPLWVRDAAAALGPPRARPAAAAGLRVAFGFPIVAPVGAVVAVVEFFDADDREPDDDLLGVARNLGRQIGQFLERGRAEQRARARLQFLADASVVIDAALDYPSTLANLARLAVPFLADVCLVDVLERGELQRVAVAAADEHRQAVLEEMRRHYPPAPPPGPARLALQAMAPQLIEHMTDDVWRRMAIDDRHYRLMRTLAVTSGMAVPLVARNRVIGALSFGMYQSGRVFGQDDLPVANELARRAAIAIDNSRLYEERTRVAATLQRALLPPELPDIPGAHVDAKYVSAGEGDVGGDFYDLVPAPGGGWFVAVGDVCGKDVEAAATTGVVRHSFRSLARREDDPARLLSTINEILVADGHTDRFCTMCLLRWDGGDGRARLAVSMAGHPPPLLRRADGTVLELGEPGYLLGAFDHAPCSVRTYDLGPGDAVVLYTDGVTERRRAGEYFGEAGLKDLLRRAASPVGLATQVAAAVEAFAPEPLADDLAVVSVHVLAPA